MAIFRGTFENLLRLDFEAIFYRTVLSSAHLKCSYNDFLRTSLRVTVNVWLRFGRTWKANPRSWIPKYMVSTLSIARASFAWNRKTIVALRKFTDHISECVLEVWICIWVVWVYVKLLPHVTSIIVFFHEKII